MAAFEGLGLQAIISCGIGCGAHLAEQFAASSGNHGKNGRQRQGNEAHAVNSIPNSQAGSLTCKGHGHQCISGSG
jgi:hypothetical protein